MKIVLNLILAAAGIGTVVFSVVMLVMSVCFGELGRIVFYGMLLILSVELVWFTVSRLIRERNPDG